MACEWSDKIFSLKPESFEDRAFEIFRYQYSSNPLYRQFADTLGKQPDRVNGLEEIPFLPISFFKTHAVKSGIFEPAIVFQSSGTTGMDRSRHELKDLGLYEASFLRGFDLFYGSAKGYCILGLLPSYLEQGGSSLVFMVDRLIRESGHADSGFYLHNLHDLSRVLQKLEKQGTPTLLIGVTYALLDFAEQFPQPLRNTRIMETGGMKGRKKEITRMEVHAQLKTAFHLSEIHSEYGMTELLSQAYSHGEGLFQCPPWMRVLLREEEDPLSVTQQPGRGIINIIDLANIHSCAFIATDDAGKLNANGSFEVLGRVDHSDLRGCSLLAVSF